MSEGVWHQEGEGEEGEGREREEKGGEMSVLLRPFFFSFLGDVLGNVGGMVGAAKCWLRESARLSEGSVGSNERRAGC